MAAFESLEQAEQACYRAGLSQERTNDLIQSARPSIHFETKYVSDDELFVGQTKLGGDPDLPEELPWPTRPPYSKEYQDKLNQYESNSEIAKLAAKTFPLSFIAQFDLTTLMQVFEPDPKLPSSGHLWLFADNAHGSGVYPEVNIIDLIWMETEDIHLLRRDAPSKLKAAYNDGLFNYGYRPDRSWDQEKRADHLVPSPGWTLSERWCLPGNMELWRQLLRLRDQATLGGCQLGGWGSTLQKPLEWHISGFEWASDFVHVLTISEEGSDMRLSSWHGGYMHVCVGRERLVNLDDSGFDFYDSWCLVDIE